MRLHRLLALAALIGSSGTWGCTQTTSTGATRADSHSEQDVPAAGPGDTGGPHRDAAEGSEPDSGRLHDQDASVRSDTRGGQDSRLSEDADDRKGEDAGPRQCDPKEAKLKDGTCVPAWPDSAPSTAPDLLVAAGKTIELEPGIYVYDSVTIDGTVRVKHGSEGWLVLASKGDFTLAGRIESRGALSPQACGGLTLPKPWASSLNEVPVLSQDGEQADGGAGGTCWTCGYDPGYGGKPAFGNGGGGAGSSVREGCDPAGFTLGGKGGDATKDQGGDGGVALSKVDPAMVAGSGGTATSLNGTNAVGGNAPGHGGGGGFRGAHGGCVYLRANGTFYVGKQAAIDVGGGVGGNGGIGITSGCKRCKCGGAEWNSGAGGGGGAGGNGGSVAVRYSACNGCTTASPNTGLCPGKVNTSGGTGGKGGKPTCEACSDAGQGADEPGEDGEPGSKGALDCGKL